MTRSIWKGPYVQAYVLKGIYGNYKMKMRKCFYPTFIKFFKRNTTILSNFIKKKLRFYTGSRFIYYFLSEKHVSYKMGEFAVSRKFCIFNKKKKKKKKKKR